MQANRGFFVAPLTAEQLEEVFSLRLKLEPEAFALASLNITDLDRRTSKAALIALEIAPRADLHEAGRLRRAFHMSLINPMRNRVTLAIIERIFYLGERYAQEHLTNREGNNCPTPDPPVMYDIWAAGKSRELALIMHDYISATLLALRKKLNNDFPKLF